MGSERLGGMRLVEQETLRAPVVVLDCVLWISCGRLCVQVERVS